MRWSTSTSERIAPSITIPIGIATHLFMAIPTALAITIIITLTTTTMASDDELTVMTLKAMLADALSMLERAEIVDFNGHMSARLPGSDHVLINAGASARSALTARDIVTIDFDGRPRTATPCRQWNFTSTPRSIGAARTCKRSCTRIRYGRRCSR